MTKSPNDRRRILTGCGVRFLGAAVVPVAPVVLPVELDELEVRRRGMAGVLGSCAEWGEAELWVRGVLSLQRSYGLLRRASKGGQQDPHRSPICP
ncbi:hypothetical protein GCM10010103_27910 [Streptomyces paradoxus]